MAKVYVTRCVVKKDGKQYKKGAVIEGLTNDEIKRGLADKWLEAVGSNEPPTEVKNQKGKGWKKRNALVEKALELGIDITDEMTDEEIERLITEQEAGAR